DKHFQVVGFKQRFQLALHRVAIFDYQNSVRTCPVSLSVTTGNAWFPNAPSSPHRPAVLI
ncbi:MAG: hypothetical protein WB869_14425, partial [Candidatus Acidiferrales bacterium]